MLTKDECQRVPELRKEMWLASDFVIHRKHDPIGCFTCCNGAIHYNNHPSGAIHRGRRTICKKGKIKD